MSLLPEVERELLRVARLPLPDEAANSEPARERAPQVVRHLGRLRRPSLSGVVAVAVAIAALAIAAVFISALRGGHGTPATNREAAHTAFPGAPRTQTGNGGGVTDVCSLAPRNRYLPARAGCVTALVTDFDGNRRPDLLILYSVLSHELNTTATVPVAGRYVASAAYLELVRSGGAIVRTRILEPGCSRCVRSASILALAHISDDPGAEVFLQAARISSGNTALAYGYHDGRLVLAGPLFYGGDSGAKSGFNCLPGNPPRLVSRTFIFDGASIYGAYRETDETFAWQGARLVKIAQRTFRSRGQPPASETEVGPGCIAGIETYPLPGGATTSPALAPTGSSIAVSTAGLGRGGEISTIARWRGRLYAAGSYFPTAGSLPLRCPSPQPNNPDFTGECEPVVWVWSSHAGAWRPVFANVYAIGYIEPILAAPSALLVFSTGDGTRLWRSTTGRTFAAVALPRAMATGELASAYLAGSTIVAVVGHPQPSEFEDSPVVWTSADGSAWSSDQLPSSSAAGRSPS